MKTTLLLAALLSLSACGRGTPVEPLDPKIQEEVHNSLKNGQIPTPGQVDSGNIPAPKNPCETFRAKLPTDWTQGFVSAPENPAAPDGRQIRVFYYAKLLPGRTPVVFFNGGPGSDSHGSYRSLTSKRRDGWVFIDQRGNGCSDFYPQGDSPEILERLRHYGSRGIVSDSELVRRQLLGDRPWIAFGQSYGAFIVHRYATVAPESLKGALAHANTITASGYDRLKKRIASQARVLDLYFAQYPGDRELLQELKDSLASKRCFHGTDRDEDACGYDVIETIADTLLGFSDQWKKIHEWIGTMVTVSVVSDEGIGRFLNTFFFGQSNPLNSKRWANRVIGWVDRNIVPTDAYTCEKIHADLLREGIDLSRVLSHECMAAIQFAPSHPRDSWEKVRYLRTDWLTLPDFIQALQVHPRLSFFLYSGRKDPYVPVEEFEEELAASRSLPNLHYTHFQNTGHDGYRTEPQVWSDLESLE